MFLQMSRYLHVSLSLIYMAISFYLRLFLSGGKMGFLAHFHLEYCGFDHANELFC